MHGLNTPQIFSGYLFVVQLMYLTQKWSAHLQFILTKTFGLLILCKVLLHNGKLIGNKRTILDIYDKNSNKSKFVEYFNQF